MKEKAIYARPHQKLRGWQAFRLGDAIVFYGRNADFEEVGTGRIQFFDSDKQCVLSEDGVVWHIPEGNVTCQDFQDCTPEILELMNEPRCSRDWGPFPIEKEVSDSSGKSDE